MTTEVLNDYRLPFMFQSLGDLEKGPGSGTSAGKRSNLPKFRKVSLSTVPPPLFTRQEGDRLGFGPDFESRF